MDKAYAYPTISNASNYIHVKKNRILYRQYVEKNPEYTVCNNNILTGKYPSYDLRLQVKKGCLWNQKVCLKNCENLIM
jgi:hypothetical protein